MIKGGYPYTNIEETTFDFFYSIEREKEYSLASKNETLYAFKKPAKEIKIVKINMKEEEKWVMRYLKYDGDNVWLDINTKIVELINQAKELEKNKINFYQHFKIPKSDGKMRDIYAPEEGIKNICKSILPMMYSAYQRKCEIASQYAYLEDRCVIDNAKYHKKNKMVYKFDIKGFFDSCSWGLVKKKMFFLINRLQPEEERLLKKVLINPETGGVYQGNPLSGMLGNAIVFRASWHIQNKINKLKKIFPDIKYSIYSDDITISSNSYLDIETLKSIIEDTFEENGLPFTLKKEKTIMQKNNGRKVTGVRINHLDETTVPRFVYNNLRLALHHLRYGKAVHLPPMELQGLLRWAYDATEGDKVIRLIKKYSKEITKYCGLDVEESYSKVFK